MTSHINARDNTSARASIQTGSASVVKPRVAVTHTKHNIPPVSFYSERWLDSLCRLDSNMASPGTRSRYRPETHRASHFVFLSICFFLFYCRTATWRKCQQTTGIPRIVAENTAAARNIAFFEVIILVHAQGKGGNSQEGGKELGVAARGNNYSLCP